MNKKTTLLIFGLDGATWKILNPFLKKGKLPFLEGLIKKGNKGILESTVPPLTSTAWASFQTGLSPQKHGIWGFFKPTGELYNSKDIEHPTFYQILSKKGKSCALINMPLSYPIKKVRNCAIVSSFLTPKGKEYAYPKSLQKELEKINYQIDLDFGEKLGFAPEKKLTPKQKQNLFKQILALIDSRKKASLLLVEKKPWDLFFVLFKATDVVQHYFWNKKETLKVCQAVDRSIKKIVNKYQDLYPKRKIKVLILSDHGFHPTAKKDLCFYPLLRDLDILPPISPNKLKLLRGIRKTLKIKKVEKRAKSDKIKVWDYGLDWPIASPNQLLKLAANLRNLKLKNKKVFKRVELIKQIPGKIIWITNPDFAPNSDPLSSQIFYPKNTPLLGHHHSDPKGIFISSKGFIRNKKLKITRVANLILKNLN